jgi:site-specific DNA recombinase
MQKPKPNGSAKPTGTVRCAIYTRKSTDEGLDRDFNSLDNQREAAENYIQSQRHEGWEITPDRYDDGGFSGGNLERPALRRLMSDIEAGKIDRVIVYKIDRLSRSLFDFAKLVDFFEKNTVGIVSVTQRLDTSTSMGRLTLNMLLSFAQFEREMIADRTRDKVHAARRRGKFTGGSLILGYDCDQKAGRLVVNEVEAGRVREIFHLFIESPSLVAVLRELNRRGWMLKRWTTRRGLVVGGGKFDKFSLRRLLTSHAYIGKVLFKGTVYDAEHPPIVDQETWDRVQSLLKGAPRHPGRRGPRSSALLGGILYCTPCDAAMTPSFSQKGKTRYRYYVCHQAHRRGWGTCPSKSVPAVEIEKFVVDRLRSVGTDPDVLAATVEEANKQLGARKALLDDKVRRLRKELDHAHADLRRQIRVAPGDGKSRQRSSLATREDAIQTLEARLEEVGREIDDLRAMRIEVDDLRAALQAFDPVWERLTAAEQARVVQLLVERIDYDGATGKLAMTFRSAGVRTLAAEQTRATGTDA